jgi:hypothetical protein
MYQIKARDFPFNLIPKELLYIKNNYSKCELELDPALGVLYTSDGVEGLGIIHFLLLE